MVIIETSIFNRRVGHYLNDEAYRDLQNALVKNPKSGSVIKSSGGFRKLRFSYNNLGKRKSLRVIYLFKEETSRLLMVFIYAKNEMENLTPKQIAQLKEALGDI